MKGSTMRFLSDKCDVTSVKCFSGELYWLRLGMYGLGDDKHHI